MSAEGRLIAGRYRLHERIGSGAMGVVWRAVDERLQRTVAVKQLLLQPGYTQAETEEARERSMREGRIAARLQHQNAIAVFDVAEDGGQPVLVMEYLPSESLASIIAERGVLPPLEVARIGAQVAGALDAAHMAGIIHRDLKPGNILLGDNGQAKITDFGISRAIGDVAVTKSGILAGTPAYLSPEVALGRDPAPASDVFSLGSTLYAALEGHPPFGVDENAISLLHRVSRGQVEPPRQAGPMTAALMQLLRPDPVERPTMAQAKELLQAVVDGRPVPNSTPNGGWQHGPGPVAGAPPAGAARPPQEPSGTRVGPPTAAGAGPHTRVGESVADTSRDAGKKRRRVITAIAVCAAILLGILVANAFAGGPGSGSRSNGAPSAPAPSSTAESPPSTTAPATTAPATTAPTTTRPATTTPTSTAPTTTAPATTGKKVSKKQLEAVVRKYFKLVPDKLDRSWQLLGPQLKSTGREDYEEFWDSIKDVTIVRGPRAVSSDKVVLTLRYTKDEGEKVTESHVLGMIVKDGQPLINTDTRA